MLMDTENNCFPLKRCCIVFIQHSIFREEAVSFRGFGNSVKAKRHLNAIACIWVHVSLKLDECKNTVINTLSDLTCVMM